MTQCLRNALWLPNGDVQAGEIVEAQNNATTGSSVVTSFTPAAKPHTPEQKPVHIANAPPPVPNTGQVWVDITHPSAPQTKVFTDTNTWIVMPIGQTLPPATRQGQVPVAGAGPNFIYAADDIDCGRY